MEQKGAPSGHNSFVAAGRIRTGMCSKCGKRERTSTSAWCSTCAWSHKAERNQAIVDEAMSAGCLDCGETDRDVLDFDHVPGRGTKVQSVRTMRASSIKALREEIAKCDVVCANCHRRREARRRRELAVQCD